MSSESTFKWVFIALASLVAALLLVLPGFFTRPWCPGVMPCSRTAALLPLLLLVTLYVVLVAGLTYRDARRRGMDPWLWATVATFVPYLIGVILYLIVRTNVQKVCDHCGRGLRADYRVCPYCGRTPQRLCPECGKPLAADWNLCPHCGRRVEQTGPEHNTPPE